MITEPLTVDELVEKYEQLEASHARLLRALTTIREVSQPEDYSEHDLRHWLATCHTISDQAIKEES